VTLTDAGQRAATAFHGEVTMELEHLLSPRAPRDREQFRAAMAAIIAQCPSDPRLDPPVTERVQDCCHEGRVVGDRTILLGLLAGILLAMSLYIRETGATWPSSGTAP
jgi:hypothetical protein